MIKAAIVGATGIVGQQFIVALNNHPWIQVTTLAASESSANRTYVGAITDPKSGVLRWFCDASPPSWALDMPVQDAYDMDTRNIDIVFSAVESEQASVLEPRFASSGKAVISTASAFRYDNDVPMIIPGVNSGHAKLVRAQQKNRGWKGFITPIPNCTTTGLVITLKPIYDAFGIDSVIMTSMQAMSGAGRSSGILGIDIIDNILPYIAGEELKVERETQRILGDMINGAINPAQFNVSCTCTRVNVSDGHTESVFVSTKKPCEPHDVAHVMRGFGKSSDHKLPSSPEHMIIVHDDKSRPQPRLDRNAGDGMSTVVGRIRKDAVFQHGVKYLLVSHNTKMGAAKGAVLVAEMLIENDYVHANSY